MWKSAAVALGGVLLFLVTGCVSGGQGNADGASAPGRTRAIVPGHRVVTDGAAARPRTAPGGQSWADSAPRPSNPNAPQTAKPTKPSSAGPGDDGKAAGVPIPPKASPAPRRPDGFASYYADRYHGRRTANGERFDVRKLTAAHRTLPFGTVVRVTHATNGRSVVVRINDRGPFVAGRVIDLSPAAARQLDMLRAGLVPVRLEIQSSVNSASRLAARS